jgi:hypothetical protein
MKKKKNDGHRDAYWHSVQILFAAEKRAADLCLRMHWSGPDEQGTVALR